VTEPEIPDVNETDLTREEMEAAAEELGVEADGLDDQQLLEQLGVALGELDEDDVETPERPEGDGDEGDDGDDGDAEDAEDGDEGDEDGDDDENGGDEQRAVGEPIDGPTRDELRDELRERDLPVSGTKDELAERLAEATEDDGEDD
jgi:hypothetical protein